MLNPDLGNLRLLRRRIHGPVPFHSYKFHYNEPMPPTPPKWMTQTSELYAHDPQLILQQQLAMPEFPDKFIPTTYRRLKPDGDRVLCPGTGLRAKQYGILFVYMYIADQTSIESDCPGPQHPWCNVLATCNGKRRNHRLSRYG